MRSFLGTKPLTVVLGLSLCGVTGYLLYLLFKHEEDDDDDYNSTIPKTSTHKIVNIKVPKNIVREIIGRNGKTIRALQDASETSITFKDLEENAEERVCVIRGTQDGCNAAENMIFEIMSRQPSFESVDMFVPQFTIPRIIGRCGETITEIANSSGAKIRVDPDGANGGARRIIIKGTNDQVNLARSFIDDIVEKVIDRQNKVDSSLAKREPRIPAKPTTPNTKPLDSPKTERISPMLRGQPADTQFEVYVSAMVDPSHFWLQIVGPKATELDLLVEEMTDYYVNVENREAHALTTIQTGDLVAAPFQYDNKWYRAEILKVEDMEGDEKKAELYYVDYGDTDWVSSKSLCELRTDFLKLHFQAIEVYLASVDPVGESWTEEAVDKFEEWTYVAQWKKLSAKLNGKMEREKTRAKREGSPVHGVDLYDVNNERDIDIAEELVKAGYATFKKDEQKTSSRPASHNSLESL